uniref:Tetraspanin n=1 Tax=Trichuris muris TaxID=70415 RepID=A0A5S6QYF2_TRIMR
MGRGKWVERAQPKSSSYSQPISPESKMQSTIAGQSTYATQIETAAEDFGDQLTATTRFLQYTTTILLVILCHLALLSSIHYAKLNETIEQVIKKTSQFVHEENRTLADTIELVKTPVPLLISLGYIQTAVALLGIWGIVTVQTRCINYYAVLTITFLIAVAPSFLIAAFATWVNLEVEAEVLYKSYISHFYGTAYKTQHFEDMIDELQSSYGCCGVDGEPKLGAYSHVIYYTENTNWGIVQAAKIKWDNEALFPMTPESCCRIQEPGCSEDRYENRLDVSSSNVEKWNKIIYTEGCRKDIPRAFTYIAVRKELISALCIHLITIGMAIAIAQSIGGVKRSSVDWDIKLAKVACYILVVYFGIFCVLGHFLING